MLALWAEAKVAKMPAKSKAQFGLMGAACAGKKTKSKISKKIACEYIKGQSPKGLPKKVKKK